MKRLFEAIDEEVTFGEEIQINDFQVLLPVIIDGEEMSTDDINFIIEPHIVGGETLYQPHINIVERLRHKGLGYKIYKAFIHEFGNLYSSHWCRTNNLEIPAIYAKLAKEPDITVERNSKYYFAYLKGQR